MSVFAALSKASPACLGLSVDLCLGEMVHLVDSTGKSCGFIMGIILFLVLLSINTFAFGMGTEEDYTWHLQRAPQVLDRRTVIMEPARFEAKTKLLINSTCGIACQKQLPLPTVSDLQNYLSYETLYNNGTRTLTEVDVRDFDMKNEFEIAQKKGHSRRKRQVFGLDSRFSIGNKHFITRYPFSTAVKISTGCTGILVSQNHVLTAAHCIHDGKDYVKGAKRLRVGFLKMRSKRGGRRRGSKRIKRSTKDKPSFQWSRVKRTQVPKGWFRGVADDIAVDYDYAILELKRPQKHKYMEIGISPSVQKMPNNRIHFSGFDNDRPGKLVYRFCPVSDESNDLFYQYCDANPGSSGSGIYIRLKEPDKPSWKRKIIGVFSGHQWVDVNGVQQDYNVAVRITPLKYAQICFWIHGNYADCRDG
ncbi:hypothetical protein chiPu_0002617 [Chiloscyllium punctatum]|uniref:Inactive serine protease 35 n=2 Tax=Chiloscyllium punctatum TaxID=137246 RepID=A0A401S1G0_CHIPU|nr:hypothetical protein [Chiloscyllium punctatum]